MFEEHSSSFSSPYLFNGKELDRETNLTYMSARYLDMKTSLWLNVDPLAEKFYMNSPYIYVSQNPINLIDPTGMGEETAGSDLPKKGFFGRTVDNVKNWFSSGSDYKGIPKNNKSNTNYSVTVGEQTATFLPDDGKIYERVNQTTSIVYTIGSNEAPEYMFHYPRDLGSFSQEGSDGYIWTGCMSCHAPNGAYNFAARNSQEYNAGQLLSIVLQGGLFGVANSPASISSMDDVMLNPNLLKGKTPSQVANVLEKTPGWKVESLAKGSQKGNGYLLREYNSKGNPTGPQIRWHPGGGHHGPKPYWRVVGRDGDLGGIIR